MANKQNPYRVVNGISFNEREAHAHMAMDAYDNSDIEKMVSKMDLVTLDEIPMIWNGCFAGLITLSRNTFTA
jgi:hypothetical protein